MYKYGLDPGISTKCKIVYKGRQILRLKGTLKRIPCGRLLVRDPEYEKDMILERELNEIAKNLIRKREEEAMEELGADYVPPPPKEDKDLVIKYVEPKVENATLLMRNEPPYVPCIVCKDAAAQFMDDGNVPFDREAKRSQFEKFLLFCSVSCAKVWARENDRHLPMGFNAYVDNSPRTGVCRHKHHPTGAFNLHLLPTAALQMMKLRSRKARKEGDRVPYEEAERAHGQPHPMWTDQKKRSYRYHFTVIHSIQH